MLPSKRKRKKNRVTMWHCLFALSLYVCEHTLSAKDKPIVVYALGYSSAL